MKNQNQYRQGDVFLESIQQVLGLENAKVVENNILAYGEGSGHVHILDAPKGALRELDGKMYVVLDKPTTLQHIHQPTGKKAEHNPFEIPNGVYEVIIQREYNPYDKKAQEVVD